ncbi:MAG: Stealth CR1 domain-containing protein [Lachnospiraceae bacterium]|nr:Stealth CR1 domain-containing protein [Lachnospiraceae bacterium]
MAKTDQTDYPIDFVLLWVDDSDPQWRALRKQYAPKDHFLIDDREARYRDFETLRYWFRAVEKFAPWVNKIYFITCGHVPAWLNLDAQKLVHVKHSDYIPEEYLPTFSSHPIELNINRIPELSEHFVYFNDDTFICRSIPKEIFYRDGKPVHQARMHAIRPGKIGSIMPHIYLNSTEVINEHFDMHEVLKKDRDKWLSVRRNGIKTVLENMYCSQFVMFPGFKNEHLPVPILKSTMDTIWKLHPERLDATCRHRFRDVRDVNQFVFRYWQMVSGNFVPEKMENLGGHFTITSDREAVKKLCKYVEEGKYPLLCLNDADEIDSQEDFEWAKAQLLQAFDKLLPEKSAFEK